MNPLGSFGNVLRAGLGIAPSKPQPTPSIEERVRAEHEKATVDKFTGRFESLRSELGRLDETMADRSKGMPGIVDFEARTGTETTRTATMNDSDSVVSVGNWVPNGYGGVQAEEFYLEPKSGLLTVLQGPVGSHGGHVNLDAEDGHRKLQIDTRSGKLVRDETAKGGLTVHEKMLAIMTGRLPLKG